MASLPCQFLHSLSTHDILLLVRRPNNSLADQAYHAVREMILRGKLPLGAVLSRRRLTADLGMSMLPVSEAVQRLESEGLLESKPQVGTRVRIPTEEYVRDRFLVREALESQSARLFAERASLQQRQEVRLMAEQMDTLYSRMAAGNQDTEFAFTVHSYHFQLHMRIADYAGSDGLREMIQKNNVLVFNWLFDMTGHARQPPKFHQQLVKVLTRKDVGAADAAMREHVRFGVEETVRTIKLLEPSLERKWRVGRTVGV